MVATYVGSRYFKWVKNGEEREGTNVYLVRPFKEHEKEGAAGDLCAVEYVSRDFRPQLAGLVPGEQVNVSYEPGFKGQAVLDSISPVEPGERSALDAVVVPGKK